MEAVWFMAGYFTGCAVVYLTVAVVLRLTKTKIVAVKDDEQKDR